MTVRVEIQSLENFEAIFGSLGLKVGSRIGADRRTQDDKEWYVVRRFLKIAIADGLFLMPLIVEKASPPEPDFVVKDAKKLSYIEVTEATVESDQQEMTALEKSNESAVLIGSLGGRFSDGASHPEIAWVADILTAIERKKEKSIYLNRDRERHLVIYPNSNASSLIFDEEDEIDAFNFLKKELESQRDELKKTVNDCAIHILSKEFVCLDLLDSMRLVKR